MGREEHRRISVLFIDAVGSTPYTERVHPELVRATQTEFYATVRRVVRRYGGVVEKFIGDAAMAIFGAPVTTERDAFACVSAGLELQRQLGVQRGDGWSFRVGIATGEALVDLGSAYDGGQAFVAGDVVNTAARLQSEAPAGAVLVCGATQAATRETIGYQRLEPVTLRGRSTPTQVWLAQQVLPADTSGDDDVELVGRDHELWLLVNALDRVTREHSARLVTVIGPAGIGKSRLVRELRRRTAATVRWQVHRAGPFDAAAAPAESGSQPEPLPEPELLPEPLTGAGQARPAVLVFEDLQWADARLLRHVEELATRPGPLLVLATARPELVERDPAWAGSASGVMTISLTPLRDEAMEQLLGELLAGVALSDAALTPKLVEDLFHHADGMPRYAREYVRLVAEQGPPEGQWPVPPLVGAVVANRIDQIDATEREALQAAAVAGESFWPGAVAAVLEQPPEAVAATLRALVRRDLVRELPGSAVAGEPELAIRHDLVRQVCYERQPRGQRLVRHTRVASWLAERADAGSGRLTEALAAHRYAAFTTAGALGQDLSGYAEAALAALREATRRSLLLGRPDEAEVHIERATLVAGSLPEDTTLAARMALLELELALARDPAVGQPEQERLAELAESLYLGGHHGDAARAWTLLGQLAWLRADRAGALRCLDRAVELFDSEPDTPEKAQAYEQLGRLHMLNYEHTPALGATEIAAEIADRLGMSELAAQARITAGMCRFQAGEPDALSELQAALEFCTANQLPSQRRAEALVAAARGEEGLDARLVVELADLAAPVPSRELVSGDWDVFLAAAQQALDAPTGEWELHLRGARAWMRALRGDAGGALDDARHVLKAARSSGFWRLQWSALAHGALCHAVLGQYEEARSLLRELGEGWRRMRTIASAEWVPAAAHAAVTLGPDAAAILRETLEAAPHQTAWSRAALASVEGALAAERGDPALAASCHMEAAAQYADVGDLTDRAFALAAAARALTLAGDPRAADIGQEVASFAARNRVVGTLLG